MAVRWRVDELVERRGWSARELAERAGLDVKTVRAIVTGRATRVDLETIGRLAEALGVAPGDLWRQSTRLRLADRWEGVAGSGGRATKEEMDWVLGRTPDEFLESGLERATRST
jgi:DNA-binding Xre family transcriptional regulator